MAGQTSPFAFPYPTGTDRVADGDNAIQALAERVDDTLVGASAGVALSSQMTNIGAGAMVLTRGSMVTLAVECRNTIAWNPAWELFTIPVGYRPPRRFVFAATTVTGSFLPLQVLADGKVLMVAVGTPIPINTDIYGSASYALAV